MYFFKCHVPSGGRWSWLSIESVSLLSGNFYDFLEKIVEWIPVAFSTILNLEYSFLGWLQAKPTETNLPCHLTYSWSYKRERFMPFPWELVHKWIQLTRPGSELVLLISLLTPLTIALPAHSFIPSHEYLVDRYTQRSVHKWSSYLILVEM